ncbi:hippocampus abundant transcript 1 protein-like [Limulus polyphemus]|uniref:Hippocampus abundant transcript 1 protein-like n=1 Tax=Limulus polyphemus TaxID=6850 RepID=A0ABM1BN69_LIMPO|nr:hippocampus abundant transcript 1 protein-like [Limulus polyphemus]
MPSKMSKKVAGLIIRSRKNIMKDGFITSGMGEPSVYHAAAVIFLEFFAWGLLTTPMITVLNDTFPDHTFLMNGLIMGIKGFLSFLSAPLVGALSDIWGRKVFLLLTVFFTCSPIPLMRIYTWWYFAMISISGIFAVTFSVVFAYVADVTEEQERSSAYGLVSATFAASLVTSPALGAYLSQTYSDNLVVALASAIALLDFFFILVAVPESLPEKLRPTSREESITWKHADPFSALRKVGKDQMILMLCMAVFLSYLPEAGQYSCFFVYLRLVMGFSAEEVALFIAVVGLLSVVAQTMVLTLLMKTLGNKNTIMVGLFFEMLQLMCYGFCSQRWILWAAGGFVSMCSITYPAISAFVSTRAEIDKQGVVQGMITGMRGLCNGLGPAVYGLIFYLFHVDLSEETARRDLPDGTQNNEYSNFTRMLNPEDTQLVPGPPFVFGAFLVMVALLVAAFIPESHPVGHIHQQSSISADSDPDIVHKCTDGAQPLLQDSVSL